jgi:hypothetical protein
MTTTKIIGGMILLGIFPMPYDYYDLLRLVVAVGLIYFLYQNWSSLSDDKKIFLVLITVIFNPLIPLHFSKTVWMIIDLVCGGYVFFVKDMNQRT